MPRETFASFLRYHVSSRIKRASIEKLEELFEYRINIRENSFIQDNDIELLIAYLKILSLDEMNVLIANRNNVHFGSTIDHLPNIIKVCHVILMVGNDIHLKLVKQYASKYLIFSLISYYYLSGMYEGMLVKMLENFQDETETILMQSYPSVQFLKKYKLERLVPTIKSNVNKILFSMYDDYINESIYPVDIFGDHIEYRKSLDEFPDSSNDQIYDLYKKYEYKSQLQIDLDRDKYDKKIIMLHYYYYGNVKQLISDKFIRSVHNDKLIDSLILNDVLEGIIDVGMMSNFDRRLITVKVENAINLFTKLNEEDEYCKLIDSVIKVELNTITFKLLNENCDVRVLMQPFLARQLNNRVTLGILLNLLDKLLSLPLETQKLYLFVDMFVRAIDPNPNLPNNFVHIIDKLSAHPEKFKQIIQLMDHNMKNDEYVKKITNQYGTL